MKWIVVNIGCIECGVGSDIVGVFKDKDYANEVVRQCNDKFGWRGGGHNEFEVFPMPKLDTINPEYDQ